MIVLNSPWLRSKADVRAPLAVASTHDLNVARPLHLRSPVRLLLPGDFPPLFAPVVVLVARFTETAAIGHCTPWSPLIPSVPWCRPPHMASNCRPCSFAVCYIFRALPLPRRVDHSLCVITLDRSRDSATLITLVPSSPASARGIPQPAKTFRTLLQAHKSINTNPLYPTMSKFHLYPHVLLFKLSHFTECNKRHCRSSLRLVRSIVVNFYLSASDERLLYSHPFCPASVGLSVCMHAISSEPSFLLQPFPIHPLSLPSFYPSLFFSHTLDTQATYPFPRRFFNLKQKNSTPSLDRNTRPILPSRNCQLPFPKRSLPLISSPLFQITLPLFARHPSHSPLYLSVRRHRPPRLASNLPPLLIPLPANYPSRACRPLHRPLPATSVIYVLLSLFPSLRTSFFFCSVTSPRQHPPSPASLRLSTPIVPFRLHFPSSSLSLLSCRSIPFFLSFSYFIMPSLLPAPFDAPPQSPF